MRYPDMSLVASARYFSIFDRFIVSENFNLNRDSHRKDVFVRQIRNLIVNEIKILKSRECIILKKKKKEKQRTLLALINRKNRRTNPPCLSMTLFSRRTFTSACNELDIFPSPFTYRFIPKYTHGTYFRAFN